MGAIGCRGGLCELEVSCYDHVLNNIKIDFNAAIRYASRVPASIEMSNNTQFHNLISPIIASIFAGNAIIVKGSEATAWSSSYFTTIATKALEACGHSPDIVQSVVCWPNVADHLTSHPSISHITFIGSRPVAHHVCASAAKALTPVCVELGGKDPAILLDDLSNSDFKRVASILMRGTFQSAGQNCIGIERVIALPNVYDRLIEYLTPKIRDLRSGSILNTSKDIAIDVGASISDANFPMLEALIQDAVKNGARLLAGGKRFSHPDYPRGHYFTPTLIVDVTPGMRIAQTELFAPIFLVMRASLGRRRHFPGQQHHVCTRRLSLRQLIKRP